MSWDLGYITSISSHPAPPLFHYVFWKDFTCAAESFMYLLILQFASSLMLPAWKTLLKHPLASHVISQYHQLLVSTLWTTIQRVSNILVQHQLLVSTLWTTIQRVSNILVQQKICSYAECSNFFIFHLFIYFCS